MPLASIYARYSDDAQRPTSIDDQIRRARAEAEKLGYTVPEELIFIDVAITGQNKGLAKRSGYASLLKAWDKREFEAVFVDELARLARDTLECAYLQQRIEKSHVRMVCCDGIDTNRPGWQLEFGMSGLIAAHFIRETAHRVVRGMQGQLERGFMIAKPPFGYRIAHVDSQTDNGRSRGTSWEIVPEQAELVQRMYAWRYAGKGLGAIAEALNREKVESPRPPVKGRQRYWRAATVRQLLQNPIYRGVFVWNGSPFSRAKAKREGAQLSPVEYQRPLLRLVSDALWFGCNQPKESRRIRSGGRHLLAGLASCAACGAKLSIASGGSALTFHCASCAHAKRVGVEGRQTHYVSVIGLEKALREVLKLMFNEEHIAEFRDRLRARLTGGHLARIEKLRVLITQSDRAKQRLAGQLRRLDDDEVLLNEYELEIAEGKKLRSELQSLEETQRQIQSESIERQLLVDPKDTIALLFLDDAPKEEIRIVLSRLFPRIELRERMGRYVAVWHIEVCPGALYAQISGTDPLMTELSAIQARIECGAARPTTWKVEIRFVEAQHGEMETEN